MNRPTAIIVACLMLASVVAGYASSHRKAELDLYRYWTSPFGAEDYRVAREKWKGLSEPTTP